MTIFVDSFIKNPSRMFHSGTMLGVECKERTAIALADKRLC